MSENQTCLENPFPDQVFTRPQRYFSDALWRRDLTGGYQVIDSRDRDAHPGRIAKRIRTTDSTKLPQEKWISSQSLDAAVKVEVARLIEQGILAPGEAKSGDAPELPVTRQKSSRRVPVILKPAVKNDVASSSRFNDLRGVFRESASVNWKEKVV